MAMWIGGGGFKHDLISPTSKVTNTKHMFVSTVKVQIDGGFIVALF